MNIINIENLSFKYKANYILEDINLSVNSDDFLVIIGPNGGGKSTLLKLILGLLKVQKGKIENRLKKEQLGYVPQNTNLNINFPITVLEVVLLGTLGAKNRFFSYTKEQKNRAYEALKQVNMSEYANQKIKDLSGGQRQRVFIARALAQEPKVLLLDEPTASIDVKGQKQIYDLLKKLNENICIVVVSHDISVMLNYAKKVAHINKNLVYHNLDNIQKNIETSNGHLCEVELLSSLGQNRVASCCGGE